MLFEELIERMEIDAGLKQKLIWKKILEVIGLSVIIRDRVDVRQLFRATRFYEQGLMTYEEFVERLSLELLLAERRAKNKKKVADKKQEKLVED